MGRQYTQTDNAKAIRKTALEGGNHQLSVQDLDFLLLFWREHNMYVWAYGGRDHRYEESLAAINNLVNEAIGRSLLAHGIACGNFVLSTRLRDRIVSADVERFACSDGGNCMPPWWPECLWPEGNDEPPFAITEAEKNAVTAAEIDLENLKGSIVTRALKTDEEGTADFIPVSLVLASFCVSRPTLHRYRKDGRLHGRRLPGVPRNSQYLYSRSELAKHFQARKGRS
jgi:hypothetical protein